MTSPIKFENGENDSPTTKKKAKAPAKSKSKTPKANTAKKMKTETKTTSNSLSTSATEKVEKDSIDVKKEETEVKRKSETKPIGDDKKENVKTEKESPVPKKPAAIHSFFTKAKTTNGQSSNADSSGADYNPGKAKYHPIDDAFWKHGEKYMSLRITTSTCN